MSLLAAVEIRGLTYVFLVFPLFSSNLGRIDFGGWGGRISEFLEIPLVLMLLLLLILFGFIRRLELLDGSDGFKNLGVIPAIHHLLRLDLRVIVWAGQFP